MSVSVDDVLELMPPSVTTDEAARRTAAKALVVANGVVEAYTRGCHVTGNGDYRPGVEGVILTIAARVAANPGQVSYSETAGVFTVSRGKGYQGLTLGEREVLNRYRKRAL